MHDQPAYERLCINASWLIKLRWVAVVGQLLTVAVVYNVLRIAVPLTPLLILIFLTAASNIWLCWWFPGLRSSSGKRPLPFGTRRKLTEPSTRRDEGLSTKHGRFDWLLPVSANSLLTAVLGGVMMLDLLNLTALLYFTGGPNNPFAFFYLVNLGLAANLLPARWAWFMNGLAVLCMGVLLCTSRPVAELSSNEGGSETQTIGDLTTAEWGLFVAFVACASVIVYFTTRLTGELRRREAELFRAEMLQARSEKIEALGTLAAGAAHELATPLSTIAVVAKEVERELDGHKVSTIVLEDMAVIRNELDRCRAILDRMSTESGQTVGETMSTVATDELLRAVNEPYDRHPLIQTSCSERAADAHLRVPGQALAQALRGIVQNAVDASPGDSPIQIAADCDGRYLQITVKDSGQGMTREVLQRAGEPFFTTKEPGNGMGMGLFLARSVIERIDGQIDIQSAAGEGTTVKVTLPIADREGL